MKRFTPTSVQQWPLTLNLTSKNLEKLRGIQDGDNSGCVGIYRFYLRDGDKMAPSVEKKLAELEMGLLHLQQNIDIPDITLPINPTVQAVVKKALDENRRPKVAELGDKVEDSSFLNGLQNGVNRWIREIQKVH